MAAGAGHSFPWLLAARVLRDGVKLSAEELFDVLRWYAQNRGYLQPSWSAERPEEINQEDTEKVENAKNAMEQYGVSTMAETHCAMHGIDDLYTAGPDLKRYIKGENLAFPRETVVAEVEAILAAQSELLGARLENWVEGLCHDWEQLELPGVKLPGHFEGGMLFGQRKPRFDNRIIPLCPLSLTRTEDKGIQGIKVPKKHSREFLEFRFAMLLANLKLKTSEDGNRPINAAERKAIWKRMQLRGFASKSQFADLIQECTGLNLYAAESSIVSTEDSEGLDLHPEKRVLLKPLQLGRYKLPGEKLDQLWSAVPQSILEEVFRGKPTTWLKIIEMGGEHLHELVTSLAKLNKKATEESIASALAENVALKKISGRAPFCRAKMKEAVSWVLSGRHPAESPCPDAPEGGPLYRSAESINLERDLPLDCLSNNHLVRHRLKILERLVVDIIREYADGDARNVTTVIVEAARDLREYSGMSAQEKVRAFLDKQRPFRTAAQKLEKDIEEAGIQSKITYSLIRKVRIWEEQGKECPYTGRKISLRDILEGRVDREHIIPRSVRPSDALDAMVLTFDEVNRRKGNLTAMQFIESMAGKDVREKGDGWKYRTPEQFRKAVEKMRPKGRLKNAVERNALKRCNWLLTKEYDPGKDGFLNRDLTQTSYINKLAAIQVSRTLRKQGAVIDPIHLEGSVTSFFRRSWNLGQLLAEIDPVFRDPETGRALDKGQLREVTHLHHAVDALTMGLIPFAVPNIKRRDVREWIARASIPGEHDREILLEGGRDVFRWKGSRYFDLAPLPDDLKKRACAALDERRVVQHVPSSMHGLRIDENAFGLLYEQDRKLTVQGYSRDLNDPQKRRKKRHLDRPFTSKNALGFANNCINPFDDQAGKLSKNSSLIMVNENYGVALLNNGSAEVIPFINVWKWLKELKSRNKGIPPVVLKKGILIDVNSKSKYAGIWKVAGIKDTKAGIKLSILRPEMVKPSGKWSQIVKYNQYYVDKASLKTLLDNGLSIVPQRYCGI